MTAEHTHLSTGTKIPKDMLRKLRTDNKQYFKEFKDTRIKTNRMKKAEKKENTNLRLNRKSNPRNIIMKP